MMSVKKAVIIALALVGSVNHVAAAPANTCDQQDKCLDITKNKIAATTCGGTCTIEVCITINKQKSGCEKDDAWSHTCSRSERNGVCVNPNGVNNYGFNGVSKETSNLVHTYNECQKVKAGDSASFLFKDGGDCGNSLTLPSGASCQPRPEAISSCTGNKVGKECVWTVPTSTNDCTGTGGGGGDPHFRTYDGTLYSYHGECDLIMTQSSSFDNGLGLDIHSRTEVISDAWSLISNAAIRIGSDILEVNNDGVAYINHEEIVNFPAVMASKFPVTKESHYVDEAMNEWNESFAESVEKDERIEFTIDLSKRSDPFPFNSELQNQIVVTIYRNMISVRVDAHLQDGEGMLGNHVTYGLVGRDLSTVYDDATLMGTAWQVTDKDPLLFNELGSVVYPEKCILPSESVESQTRRLRTGASQEDLERAQKACSKLSSDLFPFCVEDILRTGDFQIAHGYAF